MLNLQSVNKHGHHRQFLFLIGRFLKNIIFWNRLAKWTETLWIGEGVLDTTLCDKVCRWLAAGRWFSPGTLVSSTNKTDHYDITEILLKAVLNIIFSNTKFTQVFLFIGNSKQFTQVFLFIVNNKQFTQVFLFIVNNKQFTQVFLFKK